MSTTPTQPGAEMDAQVARMMGWHSFFDHWGEKNGYEPDGTKNGRPRVVPEYSTDTAAAWLVIEHMLTMGCNYGIEGDAHSHRVHFFDRSGFRGKASHASAPAAICLAALAALSDAGDGSSGEGG